MAYTITFGNDLPLDVEERLDANVGSFTSDDRGYDMAYTAEYDASTAEITNFRILGPITAIARSTNTITIDPTITGTTTPPPAETALPHNKDITTIGIGIPSSVGGSWSGSWSLSSKYIFVLKERSVQNNGVLGCFMKVKMSLTPGTSKSTELFAVGTEIFISSK
tara:strand:+ start:4595 stop:5089 length:495 start_codon:yes stop_codon:yes gene_type:complete